jgi:hypothetical protein
VVIALIVVLALLGLREHRRLESGLPLRYPERVLLGVTAGGYVLINLALVARAASG